MTVIFYSQTLKIKIMNYKDLQVGNYVAKFGIPILVNAQMLVRLEQIDAANKIVLDLSFIELTDELMYSLGFQRFPWCFVKDRFLITTYKTEGNKKSHYQLQVGNGATFDIKYVHQLQNLFKLADIELSLPVGSFVS